MIDPWVRRGEWLSKLTVGDRVATNDRSIGYGTKGCRIQKVVKITAKRTQFTVVDSAGVETVFDKHGSLRVGGKWGSSTHLCEVTEEVEAQIAKDTVLVKTKNAVRNMTDKLSLGAGAVIDKLDTEARKRVYILASEILEIIKETDHGNEST